MTGEALEVAIAFAVAILALGAVIAGIVLAAQLTERHGPPFKCGPEGVLSTFGVHDNGNNEPETVVVCKDGRIGHSAP